MASSGKMEGPSAPALRRDPYEVLSVSSDSSDQEIKSAYRKLALKFVTHLMGVLGFGTFCYLLGARPQDVSYVYCLFYVIFVPLRWIYYRYKKWHYYLLVSPF
ncbi:hypothetical protein ZWY2020_000281 [Hordeum vulgare]|nr:hypothetical protein ZWY2020_000281 [Hordeum vulgare]